jgi:NADH-quinone oxidoreductase subunit G
MRADTMARLGVAAGDRVRVAQDGQAVELEAGRDDRLAEGVVRVPAAHVATSGLPRSYGAIDVERSR